MRKIIRLGNSILGLKKGELYIGNLIFKRISVCERHIPSEDSIVMILDDLGDDENRRKFCFANNKIVEKMDRLFNPEKYVDNCTDLKEARNLELRIESMHRHKKEAAIIESRPIGKQKIKDLELEIASLIQNQGKAEVAAVLQRYQDKVSAHGIFFSMIWQSHAVVKWFDFMLGNDRGLKDAQKLRKLFSKIHKIRLGKAHRNGFKVGEMQDYTEDNSRLKKYPEYEEASGIFHGFSSATTHISQTNDEMKNLKISMLERVKGIAYAQDVEKVEKAGYYPLFCSFCRKYVFVRKDATRLTCGSKSCKKDHEKIKKREIRILNKQFGERTMLVDGWEKGFGGKPKRCKVCKMKLIVNSDRICSECFT